MKLRLVIAALVMLLAAPAVAQSDPAAVQESFAAYKQALIDGDGAKASALTSSDTHAFLKQTLDRALTMEAAEVQALPLLDQISILMLRHNMKAEQLREMKNGDPVAYAVDHKSFDMNEVEKLEAAEFTVTGSQAQAPISNLKGSPIPVNVYFKEEEGTWRFDLLSSIAPFRAVFDAQAGLLGALKTKDGNSGAVPLIIHLITGRAPDPNIWNPPG
ncbi:hypothetical protein [Pelagibius marinus]|uniref:hypothetical protein n=1 Tax=Pelagibius marinus TaxID=2762760 RepID=UPI001872566D|nr:hypothetical protein [Pelagibius marinus]